MNMEYNHDRLNESLINFQKYAKEGRFQVDFKERTQRKEFFKELASRKFDEGVLLEIIKKLWAAEIFNNKEYLANKIIRDNGIEKLSSSFIPIFTRKDSPANRYQNFLSAIKGIGPSMTTEMLCYTDPQNAGIWNHKARQALKWLQVKHIPVDKYRISGSEYEQFNLLLKEFANRLDEAGYQDVDLLLVDYLLWETWDKFVRANPNSPEPPPAIIPEPKGSRHDELCEEISAIGNRLGFEVRKEESVASGAKVDIIWRVRIANLGVVSYIFEVQTRGSIDSLLLNLQKAQTNPTVQKLIAVSDEEQLEKIQKEMEALPESFRKATILWDLQDVDITYQNLEKAFEAIKKLNLVNEE